MIDSGDVHSASARRGLLDVIEYRNGRVAVVAVSGEVDMVTAPQLSQAIHAAAGRGPTAVIVDLRQVTFLASAGMDVLLSAHHGVTPPARFGVVADGRTTRRPLELLGLHNVLATYATLDDALMNFAET